MYLIFSLVPATLAAVVGYFTLFLSIRSHGATKAFGTVLAMWIFILATGFPIAGTYATYADLPSIAALMRSMHAGGPSHG